MSYVLTSLSGNLISAASAGYAPTNSADVSAIASAYAESAASSKQDTLAFAYNTADQISSINGSALGGMDEAAVSSIASAYAESAASSKLDASASSSFYTTANESGFITGVDLSPYQTTADMSSYIPTSMSSDFQQVTGMSSYALSSDVSATVDLVSTQSANWGGSALALSAGPGIALTQSGNTLIAAVDNDYIVNTVETVGIYNVTTADTEVKNTFSKSGYKPIAWEHKFGFATTLNFNEENTVIDASNQLVYQGYIKNLANDTKSITFKLHVSWVKVS